MSTNLYWRPAPKPTTTHDLPFNLKKVIAERWWGHDGSLKGEEVEITQKELSYLHGLRDAGVEGAKELIAAVLQHGSVLLWIDE